LVGAAVLLALLCLGSFGNKPTPATPALSASGGLRLVVLVVFDQMRGDYPERWKDLFGEGGFRRLQQEGAWFPDCHYPYANTVTAAGHASLLTGTSPARHGIIGNDWYDRRAARKVSSVAAERYDRVPAGASTGGEDLFGEKKAGGGVSPERLLVPTVGDVLREATRGKGRTVSLSLKDRSAVLPAGRRPSACYWLDLGTGQFVTSTYYRGWLHPWVAEFNSSRHSDRWFGQEWTGPRHTLVSLSSPAPGYLADEPASQLSGRNFRHPLRGKGRAPDKAYYEALYASPFGNDLLLDLAREAIDAERLGQGDVPDLLCLSFSSNDAVGHLWGPDSEEVLDVTVRSDHILKRLLDHLDARVGRGRYLLAVTADHGICPLPEVVRGRPAGRIPPQLLKEDAEAFLRRQFGPPGDKARWLEDTVAPWLYLNRRLLHRRGLEEAEVEEALAGWLRQKPGIQAAYTRTQLDRGLPADDAIGRRVLRSFYADRSGDVMVVVQPYYLLASPFEKARTTHGTPHPYDTHVPLCFYGNGVAPGVFAEAVTPQAIAAVFTDRLGLPRPAAAEAPLPVSLTRAE
jgi:hypothetical protein